MDNLENIFNEELDLNEGIFSDAINKVGKNVKRSMDMTRAVNSRIKNTQRNVDQAVDNNFRKMNAKTDTLNDKQVQIFNYIKKQKKEYVDGVKSLIKRFDELGDEDLDEKVMDVDFRTKLKELKSLRKDIETKSQEGGFKIKDQTKKMFELVKNNKIDELKQLLKTGGEKKSSTDKSSADITTADAKPTSKDSGNAKDFRELDKVYAAYKTSFSNIFGAIEESIFSKLSAALNEEVDGKKWAEAMKFYRHYYNPTGDFHDYLMQWNKQTGGKVKKQLDAFLGKASKEQRAEFDKMIKARDDKKAASNTETKNSPEDKRYNEVRNLVGNQNFNKNTDAVLKRVLKMFPTVQNYEILGAVVLLADESQSGKQKFPFDGKEYSKAEFIKAYGDPIKGDLKIPEETNESILVEGDMDTAIKNAYKMVKHVADKKGVKNKQKDNKSKIKTRINKLLKLYNESPNKRKFDDYVDAALSKIGLKNKKKYSSRQILKWLRAAEAGQLKVESISFDIDLELYKEDIVDVLWEARYKL